MRQNYKTLSRKLMKKRFFQAGRRPRVGGARKEIEYLDRKARAKNEIYDPLPQRPVYSLVVLVTISTQDGNSCLAEARGRYLEATGHNRPGQNRPQTERAPKNMPQNPQQCIGRRCGQMKETSWKAADLSHRYISPLWLPRLQVIKETMSYPG